MKLTWAAILVSRGMKVFQAAAAALPYHWAIKRAHPMSASALIRRAAIEAQSMIDRLYMAGEPAAGSSLDQAGLRDGLRVVEDFLSHNEAGVALEHLLYMIVEPPLALSDHARADVRRAAELLGMTHLLVRLPEAERDAPAGGGA
jgi:hypothetical protein